MICIWLKRIVSIPIRLLDYYRRKPKVTNDELKLVEIIIGLVNSTLNTAYKAFEAVEEGEKLEATMTMELIDDKLHVIVEVGNRIMIFESTITKVNTRTTGS